MKTSAIALLAMGFAAAAAKDSCVECHGVLAAGLQAPALAFSDDVHRHAGFSCADCHGGDPQSDDPQIAMSRARGFTGRIAHGAVPRLCARCHSDANLMHKFSPQQRVDQLALYQTSVHGKRLAAGDTAVANCVDCHGIHNIRTVKDPRSPVHPLRLPGTCARCHADQNHMAKYKIATNQFAEYRTSVHWDALAKRQDMSAPSCATCHGNHGAAPQQVSSVAAVCGSCHALLEDLYDNSPHKPVFASMGVAGCVTCHGNHAVHEPGEVMLAGEGSLCAGCHDAQSAGGKTAIAMFRLIGGLDASIRRSDEIVGRARRSGMEVSEAALRLQEGKDALVKARVAVHTFREQAVAKPVEEGLRIAAETYQAGQSALRERDFRRMGLGISLIAILATIAGLWLVVRELERKPQADPQTPGR
jgi:predicted CXXCH cytochrome family protein